VRNSGPRRLQANRRGQRRSAGEAIPMLGGGDKTQHAIVISIAKSERDGTCAIRKSAHCVITIHGRSLGRVPGRRVTAGDSSRRETGYASTRETRATKPATRAGTRRILSRARTTPGAGAEARRVRLSSSARCHFRASRSRSASCSLPNIRSVSSISHLRLRPIAVPQGWRRGLTRT